jgi:hypothetical protein
VLCRGSVQSGTHVANVSIRGSKSRRGPKQEQVTAGHETDMGGRAADTEQLCMYLGSDLDVHFLT